eukprot:371379_1
MSERIGDVINHSFNVILLYYAIDNDTSFEDSNGYSVQDIKQIVDQYLQLIDSSKFMLLLVGLKLDTENDDYREVSTTQGANVAEEWNVPFIEVSAKTGENIKELLDIICTIYTRAFDVIDGDLNEAAAFDEDKARTQTIVQEDEEYEEYKEPPPERISRKYSDAIMGEVKGRKGLLSVDDLQQQMTLQEADEDEESDESDESIEDVQVVLKDDKAKKKSSILEKYAHLNIDPTKLKVGAAHPTKSKPKEDKEKEALDHSAALNKATRVKEQRRKRTKKRVQLDDEKGDIVDVHKEEKEEPIAQTPPSKDEKKEYTQKDDKKEIETETKPKVKKR